jgi:hypothetical protein
LARVAPEIGEPWLVEGLREVLLPSDLDANLLEVTAQRLAQLHRDSLHAGKGSSLGCSEASAAYLLRKVISYCQKGESIAALQVMWKQRNYVRENIEAAVDPVRASVLHTALAELDPSYFLSPTDATNVVKRFPLFRDRVRELVDRMKRYSR